MQQNNNHHCFWHYACALYDRPGVSDKLLQLQDQHALPVSLLLLMAWLGNRHLQVDAAALAAINACVDASEQNLLQPLRQIRRQLRSGDPALYRQCQALELAIEQQLFDQLQQLADNLPLAAAGHDCTASNLAAAIATRQLQAGSIEPALLAFWQT